MLLSSIILADYPQLIHFLVSILLLFYIILHSLPAEISAGAKKVAPALFHFSIFLFAHCHAVTHSLRANYSFLWLPSPQNFGISCLLTLSSF